MDKILITLSPHSRSERPDGAVERSILSQSPCEEKDFTKILDAVGNDGHSFYPGAYQLRNGEVYISADSFQSSRLLCVDIDNTEDMPTLLPLHALERLRDYGLDCNGIYLTFRDATGSNENGLTRGTRYRLLFILDEVIESAVHYEYLLETLWTLFPEADHRGIASIWYGGKRVIYANPDHRTSAFDLISASHTYSSGTCTTSQSIRRSLYKKFSSVPGDILPGGSKTANSISNNIPIAKNEPLRIRGWAEQLRKESELVDVFLKGSRKIWHNELRGLYSTFRLFDGGDKLWRKSIKNNYEIDDRKIDEIAGWIDVYEERGNLYHEENLIKYSPDDSASKKYWKLSQIVTRKSQKAKAVKGYNPHFISLDDARFGVEYLFRHMISKWDSKVTVLKIATGVGKSYQISISQHLAECIIVCPTHMLVQELSNDLTARGIIHHVIPEIPKLPVEIETEYLSYLRIGANNLAAGFLRSLINADLTKYGLILSNASKFRATISKYFNTIDQAVEDSIPVLCTHKRIMHTEFPNHSIVIADEDIVENMGEVKSVTIKELRRVIRQLSDDQHKDVSRLLSLLNEFSKDSTKINCEFSMSELCDMESIIPENLQRKDIQKLIQKGVKCDFISLIKSAHFMIVPLDWNDPEGEKTICFIVQNPLPSDKRIMVLSATADEFMYTKLFGDVDFFDLSMVQLKGSIRQFSNRSFSRSSFRNEETQKWAERIAEYAGDRPVVTYKGDDYQKYYTNPFRHIEDIMGTNELAGQDVVIQATPQKPPHFYRLWAALLGVDYSLDDAQWDMRRMERNGHEFRMMSFASTALQDIHCHFVESSLVQAVGRSRLLEHAATAHVFSTYPVPGANHYELKDLDMLKEIDSSFDPRHSTLDIVMMMRATTGSMAS